MARKHSEFLKFEKGVYENPHTMSLLLFLSLFSHEKSRIREDPTNVHEHLEMESGSSWWCPMKGQGAMGTNGRTENPVQVHKINR